MENRARLSRLYLWIAITLILSMAVPGRVSGEVQPITEAREKLAGITEEEQKTLEELFKLTQEIEDMKREVERLTDELEIIEAGIRELDRSIGEEQKKYDDQLYILEQVLVSYQRGGPATYLELLFQSEDLSGFLDNINLIKDISRNVSELLDNLEASKQILADRREALMEEQLLLEEKKEELKEPIQKMNLLIEEQRAYLEDLKEEKQKFEEHLASLELMWTDLKGIFSSIVGEFSRIIGDGYFTMEDLNLSFNLFFVKGSVSDETFNRILKEHSTLPEIVFTFHPDNIMLEVPDKSLVLNGHFEVSGSSALLYVVESGSFYGIPLEQASIDELFKEGPLLIDFEAVAGELVLIDINLDAVEARDGYLDFRIKAGFSF